MTFLKQQNKIDWAKGVPLLFSWFVPQRTNYASSTQGRHTCPELPSRDSGGDSKACLCRSLGTLPGQWTLQYSRWLLERSSVWPIRTWSFTCSPWQLKSSCVTACESATVFLHRSLETGWICHAHVLWHLVHPPFPIQKTGFHQIWSVSGKLLFFPNVCWVWHGDWQKRIMTPDLRSHTIWRCDYLQVYQISSSLIKLSKSAAVMNYASRFCYFVDHFLPWIDTF